MNSSNQIHTRLGLKNPKVVDIVMKKVFGEDSRTKRIPADSETCRPIAPGWNGTVTGQPRQVSLLNQKPSQHP